MFPWDHSAGLLGPLSPCPSLSTHQRNYDYTDHCRILISVLLQPNFNISAAIFFFPVVLLSRVPLHGGGQASGTQTKVRSRVPRKPSILYQNRFFILARVNDLWTRLILTTRGGQVERKAEKWCLFDGASCVTRAFISLCLMCYRDADDCGLLVVIRGYMDVIRILSDLSSADLSKKGKICLRLVYPDYVMCCHALGIFIYFYLNLFLSININWELKKKQFK